MNSLEPSCVDKLPKNLEANYKKFKATQYQVFLLFYGIPILYGILVSDTSLEFDIQKSKCFCEKFYGQLTGLYGDENCRINIHNIGNHLVDYVVHWVSLTEGSNFG